MRSATIDRRLFTLCQSVVAQDGCNTQPIIEKYIFAAVRLDTAMNFPIPECLYSGFVSPNGESQ
ncbi:hypothetical protein HNQ36_004057 [Afipia massiliensis]|uniref:Uncharacterized protein n=1 Tax=Afipia massiliensis TaxID=211460 RepID=A0A840N1F2_9BRAD|nr:hypothetical protein [Afipia massiliensis]